MMGGIIKQDTLSNCSQKEMQARTVPSASPLHVRDPALAGLLSRPTKITVQGQILPKGSKKQRVDNDVCSGIDISRRPGGQNYDLLGAGNPSLQVLTRAEKAYLAMVLRHSNLELSIVVFATVHFEDFIDQGIKRPLERSSHVELPPFVASDDSCTTDSLRVGLVQLRKEQGEAHRKAFDKCQERSGVVLPPAVGEGKPSILIAKWLHDYSDVPYAPEPYRSLIMQSRIEELAHFCSYTDKVLAPQLDSTPRIQELPPQRHGPSNHHRFDPQSQSQRNNLQRSLQSSGQGNPLEKHSQQLGAGNIGIGPQTAKSPNAPKDEPYWSQCLVLKHMHTKSTKTREHPCYGLRFSSLAECLLHCMARHINGSCPFCINSIKKLETGEYEHIELDNRSGIRTRLQDIFFPEQLFVNMRAHVLRVHVGPFICYDCSNPYSPYDKSAFRKHLKESKEHFGAFSSDEIVAKTGGKRPHYHSNSKIPAFCQWIDAIHLATDRAQLTRLLYMEDGTKVFDLKAHSGVLHPENVNDGIISRLMDSLDRYRAILSPSSPIEPSIPDSPEVASPYTETSLPRTQKIAAHPLERYRNTSFDATGSQTPDIRAHARQNFASSSSGRPTPRSSISSNHLQHGSSFHAPDVDRPTPAGEREQDRIISLLAKKGCDGLVSEGIGSVEGCTWNKITKGVENSLAPMLQSAKHTSQNINTFTKEVDDLSQTGKKTIQNAFLQKMLASFVDDLEASLAGLRRVIGRGEYGQELFPSHADERAGPIAREDESAYEPRLDLAHGNAADVAGGIGYQEGQVNNQGVSNDTTSYREQHKDSGFSTSEHYEQQLQLYYIKGCEDRAYNRGRENTADLALDLAQKYNQGYDDSASASASYSHDEFFMA